MLASFEALFSILDAGVSCTLQQFAANVCQPFRLIMTWVDGVEKQHGALCAASTGWQKLVQQLKANRDMRRAVTGAIQENIKFTIIDVIPECGIMLAELKRQSAEGTANTSGGAQAKPPADAGTAMTGDTAKKTIDDEMMLPALDLGDDDAMPAVKQENPLERIAKAKVDARMEKLKLRKMTWHAKQTLKHLSALGLVASHSFASLMLVLRRLASRR